MTTPTPPAPGQVWRGGKDNDEFYRVFSVIQTVRTEDSRLELEQFRRADLMPVTMKWWLRWSATATLVEGGESNA